MPSRAHTQYLDVLLRDAVELGSAHKKLSTGARGRQRGLGAINRTTVVICVSAWEAYVEEVVKESLELLRPAAATAGVWDVLKEPALAQVNRFNTPNSGNTRTLIRSCLGLNDVTRQWRWQNCTSQSACRYLNTALDKRHEIAHGVNPRPTVHRAYAGWLPGLFKNLASSTDDAIADHLVRLGCPRPW
ncbi:HEPN domain-containing protein [Arenimonas sp. MALMAid1274]|uniref:HEPN domain-containing protein n=1 Tax=Arenimonas sp. MALMAid1274 TaxID=3411630 RepID=UPI003B9F52E8